MTIDESTVRYPPSIKLGFLLYFGYLAIFYTTWVVNGVDYQRIGESVETTRLWYALPTLFGSAFLVIAITVLGWWRIVLFDKNKSGSWWLWSIPVVFALVIFSMFMGVNPNKLTNELLLWSLLGAMGVGFGEEMITRGSLVVGLRSKYSELQVWLYSSLLFAAIHIPNVFMGLPFEDMPIQVLLTFIFGMAMYLVRRLTGTLIIPMIIHGLWDSSQFLSMATGEEPTKALFIVYPLTIICVVAMFYKIKKTTNRRV